MSQIDLDIKLQTERFRVILDEAISKSEIGIFLVNILSSEENNMSAIQNAMPKRDFEEFENLISVLKKLKIENNKDYKTQDLIPITEEMIDNFLQYMDMKNADELSEALNVLHENPKIKFLAKSKLLLDSKKQGSLLYVETLKRLKARLIEKMSTTANEKLKTEMMQLNIEKHNKVLKMKIEDLEQKVKNQEDSYQQTIDEKQKIISELQRKKEILNNNFKRDIMNVLTESQETNKKTDEEHEVKLAKAIQMDMESEENYNKTLRINVQREKLLRSARLDVEKELSECLEKYDTDVGNKQLALDILTKQFEDEKLQLEELKRKFEEQELIYIPCMEQKEAEYQEELRNKMMGFLMEHAAKVIQRRWRRILAAKAEKKRVKKMGGKKKKPKD